MIPPGIRVPLILCAVATLVVGSVALLRGPLARSSTPAYEGPPTWQLTASMSTVRGDHTATLLRNGTVLVVGGYVDSGRVLATTLDHHRAIWPADMPCPTLTLHAVPGVALGARQRAGGQGCRGGGEAREQALGLAAGHGPRARVGAPQPPRDVAGLHYRGGN
jgi:hypothetical protein